MELEELRQRLLLRSKSSDIPPIAHPVQVPELPLSQAASKVKWETSLAPEVSARVGNGGAKPDAQGAKLGKEPAVPRPMNVDAHDTKDAEGAPAAPTEPISMLATTVGQLSAPTEAFREHFDKLSQLLEPIDIATHSAEQSLARIGALHDHLAGLAKNFQSVRAFAEQVKMLSASFEPMKGLDTQLNLVVQALYSNVKEVGAALAPVKSFQGKVSQLASVLDSIDKLEGQISGLAETFRPAAEQPQPASGVSATGSPAQVAQAA
jgi:hypothetical protein